MTTDRLVAEEAEVHQEMVLDGLRRWCSKRDGARSLALSLSLCDGYGLKQDLLHTNVSLLYDEVPRRLV